MFKIIKGSELGTYITVGAALCKDTYTDKYGKHIPYKLVKLYVRDLYSPTAKQRTMVLFCSSSSDIEELYNILKLHLMRNDAGEVIKDGLGCGIINWCNLKKHKDYEKLKNLGWLEFPGAHVVNVPLRKGLCYKNDKNGNILTDKNGRKIKNSSISLFVIVKDIRILGNDLQPQRTFISGWDQLSQRDEMERRYYMYPYAIDSRCAKSISNTKIRQKYTIIQKEHVKCSIINIEKRPSEYGDNAEYCVIHIMVYDKDNSQFSKCLPIKDFGEQYRELHSAMEHGKKYDMMKLLVKPTVKVYSLWTWDDCYRHLCEKQQIGELKRDGNGKPIECDKFVFYTEAYSYFDEKMINLQIKYCGLIGYGLRYKYIPINDPSCINEVGDVTIEDTWMPAL